MKKLLSALRPVKAQARSGCALLFLLLAGPVLYAETFWGYGEARKDYLDTVWEAPVQRGAAPQEWSRAVEVLFARFEEATGRKLAPGEHGRAALKVYTNSGEGHATPPGLTRAVIAALEKRGFARGDLLLLDATESGLRAAGYLPPLSARDVPQAFAGVPVRALDAGELFDDNWFYDSPLPAEVASRWGTVLRLRPAATEDDPEDRKSYLPAPLVTGVDFWINLPVGTTEDSIGVNGALANATLWNVSNRHRFFANPANAPVAVAEIAAIPELLAHWAFTLMPLQQVQYIGGPRFNALYTTGEPRLLLGVNPVALDALLFDHINRGRMRDGFEPLPVDLELLQYAEDIGLGPARPEGLTVEEVPLSPR